MAVRVICFYQPGCMGCMEQTPINAEVSRTLNITIEEIDAIKNPQYIGEFQLKVTPTIVILKDGTLRERFEGVVHTEQLTAGIKKYL
ncbi:MAG TPA: thioredoxin family protein [Methanoregula sp.]|nr:thioredoxin family protein [Methanoregula sp.]